MIAARKLDAILGAPAIAERLGLPPLPAPEGAPEVEPKERAGVVIEARARAARQVTGAAQPKADELRVAVVQVVGTLANRVSWMDAMSGVTSYEALAEEIDRLAADSSVDGILLEVDSFGGESAGVFDVADRIAAAREAKPVFGVANQYALSAGYALLSQADQVFVPQSGEVGSIGVVTTHMDLTAAAEKQGVRVTHVHAGAHKVDLSPFKALSPEARERLQADVEQIYDQFTAAVARGRGERLTAEGARATEARTFIGQKAVDEGLADKVGNKAAALDALFAEVEDRRMDKELAEKAARLEAENVSLKAKLAAYEKAEAARLEAEDKAFLESLRADSAAAQNPLDAADVARVEAHLKAGRREFARELGAALLKAANAGGGKPAKTVAASAPPKDDDRTQAAKRGVERLRRRAGLTKSKKTAGKE